MQTGRLFSILYLLMEHGNMTAKQLAERFEVSPRTIYSDIDPVSYTHLLPGQSAVKQCTVTIG